MKLFRWIPLAVALTLTACATPGSDSSDTDVSRDMAGLAAGLNDQLTMDVQASMVNEATAAAETSTPVNLAVARSAEGRQAQVTVTHSLDTDRSFAHGDVVRVVRRWTNARGEAVVDTVVRPKLPVEGDFASPAAYNPSEGNGIDLTGVTADYDAAAQTWTLNGTEAQSLDGVVFRQQAFTIVYTWDAAAGRVNLVSIRKHGENLGLRTARVKLDTTIWFHEGEEYLRVLDYLAHPDGGGVLPLKREVYLWSVDPSTLAAQPFVLTSGTALSFTPALAASPGSSTIGFWYRSPTAVAVTSLSPVFGDESTYPALDTADGTGAVLQESGPRTADWYQPTATADGTYVRALTRTYTSHSETVSRYADDGVTVVKTREAAVCRTTSDGTITTTWTFSDGKTRKVTITPTDDGAGHLTGYVLTRGQVAYTVVFGFGADGLPTSAAVTNSRTGVTTTYHVLADGTWS